MIGTVPVEQRVTYRALLVHRGFRGLTLAQFFSELGDPLARLALAVLVFDRSHSAFLAALAFAIGYLPALLGGVLLAPLADQLPRRELMVVCDALRAVLILLMAVPGMPMWSLFVLLLVAATATEPFASARAALLPTLLPHGPDYVAGIGLGRLLGQANQAFGFLLGGVVLTVLGARGALVADAVTFLVSMSLLLWFLPHYPGVGQPAGGRGPQAFLRETRQGASAVFRDPLRRALVLLVWVACSVFVVPEGLAVSYTRAAGGTDFATAVLTAAMPIGFTLGVLLIPRHVPARRQADLLVAWAMLGLAPLLATGLHPGLAVTALLWMLSGLFQSVCFITTIAVFNGATADAVRGRANGLASAGLQFGQGAALALGGAAAIVVAPGTVVAIAAALGVVGVLLLRASWPGVALGAVADRMFGAG